MCRGDGERCGGGRGVERVFRKRREEKHDLKRIRIDDACGLVRIL